MATNEIFREANHLSLPVPADTPAGAPVRIGVLNGFTEVPEGEGVGNVDGYSSVNFEGAFKVDVAGAITNKGQAIYITGAGALTVTASGNFPFGSALSVKGAGTGPAVVKVAPFGFIAAASA